MAETLGKTRRELIYEDRLTTKEAAQWMGYFRYKKALADGERAKEKAKADMDQKVKKRGQ